MSYPVEAGNSEVRTLPSYPTVPGRSNLRPRVGSLVLKGNPIVSGTCEIHCAGAWTGNSKV